MDIYWYCSSTLIKISNHISNPWMGLRKINLRETSGHHCFYKTPSITGVPFRMVASSKILRTCHAGTSNSNLFRTSAGHWWNVPPGTSPNHWTGHFQLSYERDLQNPTINWKMSIFMYISSFTYCIFIFFLDFFQIYNPETQLQYIQYIRQWDHFTIIHKALAALFPSAGDGPVWQLIQPAKMGMSTMKISGS